MARFFGTVQGNRGRAQRLGHAVGGLTVTAQSWNGSVEISLFVDHDDQDCVDISVGAGSTSTGSKTIYHGPIAALLDQSARKTMMHAFIDDMLVAA
jgi:hypothetical protein